MASYITALILRRHRLLFAIVCLLAIGAIVPAAQVEFDNSIENWFLEDDPALAIYDQFSEQFKADQIAVIGIFDDDVFDQSVLSVIDRITIAAAELDYVFRVNSITNSVLASRLEDGFRSPAFRETIMASPALNGSLITTDGDGAAIVVYYSRAGEAVELKNRFVSALEQIATSETRGLSTSFALTGAPVMGKAGQAKNQRDMQVLVPIMILIILLIGFGVFRSIWLSFLPLVVAAVAVICGFAFLGMIGWKMTMFSAMLVPLILAVGVADTIHVIVRFRRHLANGKDRLQAVRSSLLQLLKPCFFTAITTMIALLALLVSEIAPVRQFGVVAAIGVMVAFLASVTLVPALLIMVPVAAQDSHARAQNALGGVLEWTSRQSRNRPRMIVSFAAVLVLASGWLGTQVTVGLDPLVWFPAGDPFRIASEKVDKAFGGSLTMEFLITAPARNLNDPAVLRRLQKFEAWLLENTDVTRTFSIADLVKEAARVAREEGAAGYALPQSRFLTNALLDGIRRAGQLDGWVQADYSSARISARIPVAKAGEIVQQTPAIREYLRSEFSDDELTVQITGHVVLVGQMQEYLIRSQITSFSVALIAITLLMFLLLRSVPLGLLAMIPNLIPLIVGLGAMTVFGVALNPGTVMIMAVAVGIVVDDTVHIMTAIGRELRVTSDTSLAVDRAIEEVGRPVIVTSILLTLGFSVLVLGSFLPSQQFGGILALIIVTALLADLVLLPAVLRLFSGTGAIRYVG